jgi:hypothetical protein
VVPDGEDATTIEADKEGLFTFKTVKPGLYAAWVREAFDEAGDWNGTKFTRRRYVSSLSIVVPSKPEKKGPLSIHATEHRWR